MTTRKKVSKKSEKKSNRNNVSRSSSSKKPKAKKDTVMTKKKTKKPAKKESLIGVDPLAWLNEEAMEGESQEQNESADAIEELAVIQDQMTNDDIEKDNSTQLSEEDNIHLDTSVTIREVGDLYSLIGERIKDTQNLKIDCSAVEKTDAAGMQLLTVLYRHTQKVGKNLEWIKPTDMLLRSAALLGLTSELAFSK